MRPPKQGSIEACRRKPYVGLLQGMEPRPEKPPAEPLPNEKGSFFRGPTVAWGAECDRPAAREGEEGGGRPLTCMMDSYMYEGCGQQESGPATQRDADRPSGPPPDRSSIGRQLIALLLLPCSVRVGETRQ
eukprot:153886-Pyramimonas_sp.AAC.1